MLKLTMGVSNTALGWTQVYDQTPRGRYAEMELVRGRELYVMYYDERDKNS
jgi:hypothetical protein